ncbi:hypothetical protein [Thermococcus peptonophilus]|uniref:hypothetical protein n=1 Tax=Thermococcus peptonophilus TaxID=53952 RepID=UPI000ABAB1EA|nr:hypothetical protein [Thermococcus peptonophilus]
MIEMERYGEEGGRAPEKLWKLKVRRIGIDLVTGEIFKGVTACICTRFISEETFINMVVP